MSNSLLSGKELLFPPPGHILATLSFPFGWAMPECLLGPEGSQGPPAVLSCWEGGSCGPVAPSRGNAQGDSLLLKEVLLEGMSPPLGNWGL